MFIIVSWKHFWGFQNIETKYDQTDKLYLLSSMPLYFVFR